MATRAIFFRCGSLRWARSNEVRTDSRRTAERLPGGLRNQLADDRCPPPFAGDVPEPIPVARLVLTRNESEIRA
jgi:hypothetical protein